MDDAKKVYRQTEQDTKEAWRKSDGTEDLRTRSATSATRSARTLGTRATTLYAGTT